jgi:hypothetical protein
MKYLSISIQAYRSTTVLPSVGKFMAIFFLLYKIPPHNPHMIYQLYVGG